MLSLEGAWSITMGKLLTVSEQHFVECVKGELMDFGFGFAQKNALCTETAAVLLETRVRAWFRLVCGLVHGSGH